MGKFFMDQERIFCQIRKKEVKRTPEERIRQSILRYLFELGYPASLITLEKSLKNLSPDGIVNLPQRRLDIICFEPKQHSDIGLRPLLIIECKAVLIDQKALNQLMGYNQFIQAPLIALANDQQLICGRKRNINEPYSFITDIPNFEVARRLI